MASRPKTRARLQGALASRKDKRTSYPPPATHQEAPRNRFWGLFFAFRYKRASSSVDALRTALRPSRSPLALQLLAGLPHLLRLGGQCAKLLADALHLALDDPVSRAGVLLDPPSHVLPDGEGGVRNRVVDQRFSTLFLSIKTIYMPFLARKSAFPVRRGQGKGRWELALTSTLFQVWSSNCPPRQFRYR